MSTRSSTGPATDAAFKEVAEWRYPPRMTCTTAIQNQSKIRNGSSRLASTAGRLVGFYYFGPRGDELEHGM